MSWFEEQLEQRKQKDEEVFEEAMLTMASAVTGKRHTAGFSSLHSMSEDAIGDILKYYHLKPVDIPDSITDPEELIDYALRPHGWMFRIAVLRGRWYQDAAGPMIAYRKTKGEESVPVALLPRAFRGYRYRNAEGKMIRVHAGNASEFEKEAVCFYRPFPMKSIGIPELLTYIRNCLDLSDIVILALVTLLVTLVGMILPNLIRALTGTILPLGSEPLLWGTAVLILCILIAQQMLNVSKELSLNRIIIKTSLPVESAFLMRLLSLPASFFKKHSSGELSSRLKAGQQVSEILVNSLLSMGLGALFSLLYIVQIANFAPGLMGPALATILVTFGITLVTAWVQMRVSKQRMEYEAAENGIGYAMISGIRKIRLAGAEKRAFAKWAKAYADSAALNYHAPLFLRINGAILMAVSLAGTIAMYYTAVQTGVSPSEYIAFNASYGMVMGAFSTIAGMTSMIAKIRPSMALAEPLLKQKPEIDENREILTRISGNIELNHVCFRYGPDHPNVIDGISMKIRAGEYVAIVGKTGCGKSTLVRLLLGFENPQKGAVFYDGKDIRRVDLRSLRKRIGTVTQDGGLFQGDIYSNIVISAPQLSEEEAWEAAEIAGIADDIRAMPMGMHTVIREGQGGISGGQRQRLMIARAIAPRPKVLIFDEATSALDNLTQKRISEALDSLKCTRIVIAHRLSTIRHCDRILVMDRGRIAEEGTYEELMQKNGLFTELVQRQQV